MCSLCNSYGSTANVVVDAVNSHRHARYRYVYATLCSCQWLQTERMVVALTFMVSCKASHVCLWSYATGLPICGESQAQTSTSAPALEKGSGKRPTIVITTSVIATSDTTEVHAVSE